MGVDNRGRTALIWLAVGLATALLILLGFASGDDSSDDTTSDVSAQTDEPPIIDRDPSYGADPTPEPTFEPVAYETPPPGGCTDYGTDGDVIMCSEDHDSPSGGPVECLEVSGVRKCYETDENGIARREVPP